VLACYFGFHDSLVVVHSGSQSHEPDDNSKEAPKNISMSVRPISEVIVNFVLNEELTYVEGV
jgi:hypothetical protein